MRTQGIEGLWRESRVPLAIAAHAVSRRRCLHVLEEGTHLRTAHSIIIWLSISRIVPQGQVATEGFYDRPRREHVPAKGPVACVTRAKQRLPISGYLQGAHGFDHLLIIQATPWAGLGGHLVMEAQRFRSQVELLLHERNDGQRDTALFALKAIVAVVKIANHFEHKGAGRAVAIMPCGTGGWLVPVSSGPDGAIWRNRNVLRNIAPAVALGVKAPHGHNAVMALILAMVRAPGMMHMHGVNAPAEGELVERSGEFAQGQTMKWCRHSNLLPSLPGREGAIPC